MEHIRDQDCDICFIQETFLKEADTAKLQEIRDYGWDISSNPRKHRSGGGIAFLSRKELMLSSNEKVVKYKSFQVMEAVIQTTTGLIRLVNVYRPPYTKKARYTESTFLEEFEDYICDLLAKPGKPMIAGDFNIHVERPQDFYPKKFLDLLTQHGLHQCVPLVPTHDMGGTLDLVITTDELKKKIQDPITIVMNGTSSDHFMVLFEVDLEISTRAANDTRRISYRNFMSINVDDFKADIRQSSLGDREEWSDLDTTVSLYNTVLCELMDKHCPLIEKSVEQRERPWEDEELRQLRRKRRAAERAWRDGRGDKETYNHLKKLFVNTEKGKRCAYNRNALMASSGDVKSLYKKLNRLIGRSSQVLPSSRNTEPKTLSDGFKDFFAEKVSKIRKDIVEESETTTHRHDGNNDETITLNCRLDEFRPITIDELKDYISKMSNKFCSLDPIPTFLLKDCVDELSPILLHIVNSSVSLGDFPSNMKKAVIQPTLKKDGLDADIYNNYRPVSNLPATSKILERVVLDQLNNYLLENDLHCQVQSGYRPNHSCETLMVRMTDDIFKEIQSDNIVILVLLDLSAAFDTIDHEILIDKLLKDFGISGQALQWFKSYLEHRSFCVKIDGTLSDYLCLLFGVPQGSLLGPVLFILYIKFLQVIAAKYGLSIQLYADDSQLYIAFHPCRPSEMQDVTDRVNRCLEEIKAWMIENFMKLNESKTELLVIGKPSVLKKFNLDIKIQFGCTEITPTVYDGSNWKSLGVILDEALNMERQVNSVKQKCCWTMTSLRTISPYLDEGLKLMLVKQLIISKVDYCNALYMNLPMVRLKKLRSVLNAGVRFIYNIHDRNEDLLAYYKKAHILPIEQRVFFKVCLLSHKVIYGTAPDYLKELVQIEEPPKEARTRSDSINDKLKFRFPKMAMLKASNRRFTYYAPECWNSVPLKIRKIEDISEFKGLLKNHLYDQL